ncbi:MAG: putative metal-binding motif-containing protein [Pseudomonadota bacterium]
MLTRKFAVLSLVPFIMLATALFVFANPSFAAGSTCAGSVQGKVPWDGVKNAAWSDANLAKLCSGAEQSTEPGACFKRVSSGTVNYGGGTSWKPINALEFCAGATDASARISCFEQKIAQGVVWISASKQCAGAAPAVVSRPTEKSAGNVLKPVVSNTKIPPTKSARPQPPCPGCDNDGDGVTQGGGDCNDNDATTYPGAPEVADFNGHDEDCNGNTYAAVPEIGMPGSVGDADGDGFVDNRVCNGVYCGTDCDDTRASVNIRGAELPNRRDDDCNGVVDDHLENWWNPATRQ